MLGKLKRLKQRIELGDSNLLSMPPRLSTAGDAETAATQPGVAVPTHEISSIEFVSSKISKHKKIAAAAFVVVLLVSSVVGYALYRLFTQPKQFGPVRMTALTTGGKVNTEVHQRATLDFARWEVRRLRGKRLKQQASLWLRQVSTNSLVRIVSPESGGDPRTTFSPTAR